jgi:hypothetical protein
MRIASFNVENLFQRARALDARDWDAGRPILQRQAEINAILGQPTYTSADKDRIVELLGELGLATADDGSPFVILRQNRGHLLTRHVGGQIEIVAGGRDDWVGWVELKVGPVNALSTRHTAQVIHDLSQTSSPWSRSRTVRRSRASPTSCSRRSEARLMRTRWSSTETTTAASTSGSC